MRRLNTRAPRIAGLLTLALGAVALLALSGVAAAKDRHGDDHGRHGRHHHHQFEMREAGTISSFDAATGKLTIALIDGEMVTGLVTENTRIKCEGLDNNRLDRRDHGSGDDHGGRGNEPGDDNGGDNSGPGSGGSSGPGSTPGGPGPSNEGNQPVGGEGPEEGEGEECTTASLVPGAFVGEAELRLEGGGAVFTEVELGHDS
jgi:hypothetical protein